MWSGGLGLSGGMEQCHKTAHETGRRGPKPYYLNAQYTKRFKRKLMNIENVNKYRSV
jgi:hypothetical protein